MPRRDPHLVLGVPATASAVAIKAAWRRLARENHPDLSAGDPVASKAATRRMAEINAAYQELLGPSRNGSGSKDGTAPGAPGSRGPGAGARSGATADGSPAGETNHDPQRPPGPPRSRPGRPVTARLDLSGTFRPRNQTTTPRAHRSGPLAGQPPLRVPRIEPEPPRASDPTGPLHRSRYRRFRRPEPPSLETALAMRIEFGKFNGHSLGEISAFEPSYIDWVAGTITRDPDLVAAARVIQDDLDVRGVIRMRRAERVRGEPID
jgi:hypothetical protein